MGTRRSVIPSALRAGACGCAALVTLGCTELLGIDPWVTDAGGGGATSSGTTASSTGGAAGASTGGTGGESCAPRCGSCDPTPVASFAVGSAADESGKDVVFGEGGDVYVVGDFTGMSGLGGFPLNSVGGIDGFIGRVSTENMPLWAQTFGGNGADQPHAVRAHAGGIAVTGTFTSDVLNIAGQLRARAGTVDSFVALVQGNSSLDRLVQVGASGAQVLASGAAVNADGGVTIAGRFDATIDLGCGQLIGDGSFDVFVVRYTADTRCVWSNAFRSAAVLDAYGFALDDAGATLLTGRAHASVDFGDGLVDASSEGDAWIAVVEGDGSLRWALVTGDDTPQVATAAAWTSDDNVVVAGTFSGKLEVPPLRDLVADDQDDAFVVKLDADGKAVWATSFGGAGLDVPYAIAIGPGDDIALTGSFEKDLGLNGVTSEGAGDMFLVGLSACGSPAFVRGMGGPLEDVGSGVAWSDSGRIVVTGRFQSVTPWGTSQGSFDAFTQIWGL